jgi:hypothetical protein
VDSLRTPTGNEPLEYKVEGLVEGSKVQFRVIAVNKGGESEPSDPSPTHTVKHRKCKCRHRLRRRRRHSPQNWIEHKILQINTSKYRVGMNLVKAKDCANLLLPLTKHNTQHQKKFKNF